MSRKSLDEQRADLEARRSQIEHRLRDIAARESAQQRKLDARRKIVLGALVLGAAEASAPHRQWALSILRGAARRPADAAVIESLTISLEALS